MFSKKTSVAHTNHCRGPSTWFALESSSSTQVPWPVDQLTKAIVGIKLTSGSPVLPASAMLVLEFGISQLNYGVYQLSLMNGKNIGGNMDV